MPYTCALALNLLWTKSEAHSGAFIFGPALASAERCVHVVFRTILNFSGCQNWRSQYRLIARTF